jgi:cell division GTPase FtsZ
MAHPDATIIWGARLDETLEDTIRVIVVATGLGDEKKKEATNPAIESIISSSSDGNDDGDYIDVLEIFNNK